MAIDDNTTYGLTGAQVKELPEKIEAVKGLAKVLTSADYNYPTDNPTGIAPWLLDSGVYSLRTCSLYYSSDASPWTGDSYLLCVAKQSDRTIALLYSGASNRVYTIRYNSTGAASVENRPVLLNGNGVIDNLSSTSPYNILSAKQGKVLNDKIGGDLSNLTTTDKTSLINAINEVAAQGGATKLTTADYNYPTTGTADRIVLTALEPGAYTMEANISYTTAIGYSTLTSNGSEIFIISDNDTGSTTRLRQITKLSYYSGQPLSISLVSFPKSDPFGTVSIESDEVLTSANREQSTGTSIFQVMSQNATTGMVFADPGTKKKIRIGSGGSQGNNSIILFPDTVNANNVQAGQRSVSILPSADSTVSYSGAQGAYSVAIGSQSRVGTGQISGGIDGGVAIGASAHVTAKGGIAIGSNSSATRVGEMNIGSSDTQEGYNNSNYRLLTGLYDGQSAHDAATVAQGNTLSTSAPTTSTVGVLGQLYTDTANMHTYQCTAIDDTTDPSNPVYTWQMRW